MRELNVNEVQEVNGGGNNPWTTPNPDSGQSCINEMVEQGGIGAIGGALGGGVTSFVGAIVGAFLAFSNSEECENARE